MGCMELGGIVWFLPIDKSLPELGNRSGDLAAQVRTADRSLCSGDNDWNLSAIGVELAVDWTAGGGCPHAINGGGQECPLHTGAGGATAW